MMVGGNQAVPDENQRQFYLVKEKQSKRSGSIIY